MKRKRKWEKRKHRGISGKEKCKEKGDRENVKRNGREKQQEKENGEVNKEEKESGKN